MVDYVERFSQLVDQLDAYHHVSDPLYYAMKFLEGLKDEIRNVVPVQRPSALDTACALALLQEDVQTTVRKAEFRKTDFGFSSRAASKWALPLPSPPSTNKASQPPLVDARRPVDQAKGPSAEEKFAALRSYRRARGL